LRFTTKDGNPLPYEIETYDSKNLQATLWVRVDTLKPADPNQFIRLYWGNPAAVSESNGPGVFDSTGKYAGVWHLRFQEAQGEATLRDASTAKNDAFIAGNLSGLHESDSQLGGAASFDGTGAALLTSRLYTRPGDMTISLWFKTTTDSGGRLLGFNKWKTELDSGSFRDRQIWMDDSGMVHFGIYHSKVSPDSAKRILNTSKAFNDGKWHMVAATLSAAGIELFVDGQSYGTDPGGTAAQAYDGYWRMGYERKFTDWPSPPSASGFNGWLDEARVSYLPFSMEKLRLDFQSQKQGSRVVDIESYLDP
jgi:hypothetical protein